MRDRLLGGKVMQLPGRLRGTTLGDMLGTLHRARATGVLELIERVGPSAGRSHYIRLEDGLVARVDGSRTGARLVEILREQGALPPVDPQPLLVQARADARPTGHLLLERQVVSVQQVARALREQIRRRLEPLFDLEDAEVRFHVPRPSAADRTRPEPLSAREFLHGRPRARGGDTPRAQRSRADEGRAARSLRVLGLSSRASMADVKRAFRRLAAESHPDRFPYASDAQREGMRRRLSELTCAYHELLSSGVLRGA